MYERMLNKQRKPSIEDEHPNVPKHMHAVNKIVVQKP